LKESCIDVEQIASVLELPADDPRRRHVDSCPRCRNIARSYAAFMRVETPPEANPEAARERLAQVILGMARETGVSETASRSTYDVGRKAARWGWWLRWRRGAGPLVAAAVITLLAILLWQDHRTEPPVLRNERPAGEATLSLRPAEAVAGGGVRLTWSRAQGADRYQVRVFNSELDEVYRHAAIADTAVVINLSKIPIPPGSPGLVWRVEAFRGDDIVAVSPPGSIPLP
jgi:hypothetical protein